jgi:alcohol dehydrogenase YqhD (iron-dependent ADH family)
MLDFRFQNKTEIIFGRGTENLTGEETAKYAKRILLCSYGEPFEKKLMDTIKASLDAQHVYYVELTGIKPNPEVAKVYEGIEAVRSNGLEFVLAVGGGSVIDTAKAIAAGVKFDGDVWELYLGKGFSDALPTGVALTFPATGSESSNGSVITNEKTGYKLAIIDNCLRPQFAILNPELTFTLPAYQTFCGVADIMSHVMERYFSNTQKTDLTDRMSEAILKTVIRNALILTKDPADYDARAEIMWASTMAHNDLVGMGRTQDWASHMIGMELSAIYDSTHGATLSVLTPAWARYVCKHNLSRFVQFAMRVFDVEYDIDSEERTALEGIDRLEAFFKRIGVPVTMSELGIHTTERYMEMAEKACHNGPLGDIQKLTARDVYNILVLAGRES